MVEAEPNSCEEASLFAPAGTYFPCNKPAVYIVGWKGRNDKPIRMCEMCADHNVRNRGGFIKENFNG